MSPRIPLPTISAPRARQRYLRALLLWLAFIVASACAPLPQEWPSLQQPESPPPEVLNSALMVHRWRLEVAVLNGEEVVFDYYRPVYVEFSRGGTVSLSSERCGYQGYAIAYFSGQRYRIGEGFATAENYSAYAGATCAEIPGHELNRLACERGQAIEKQRWDMSRTLKATTEYDVTWEELILRGENAAMLLKPDNDSQ